MKRTTHALLLTTLVLPGLGQIYLGRKISGIILILLVNLLLLLSVAIVLKGAAPIISAQVTSGTISPEDILTGLDSVAGYGRALLIAFALLWGYSIVDILKRDDPGPEQN
ncbi:MAG: hypothetical protein HXX11_01485 [Desulfuromonadales bacterium]|nr:hypothetical protein [Desulfuromonadales bacterium]